LAQVQIFFCKRPLNLGSEMVKTILRRPEVEQTTGLSRSTLYAMMAEGTFPRPGRLGKRAVGWRAGDVSAWLESREESVA